MSDLSLYWTPDEFQIDGNPWPGLPLIVHSNTMRIEYLATEFLLYRAAIVGRARSPHTRYAQAHILVPFLDFMAERGLDWRDATEEQLAYYRNNLEQRALGRRRIRRVMSFICDFYTWAHVRGHIQALPFTYEAVVNETRGLLAHLSKTTMTSKAVLLPHVPKDNRLPRFFTRDDRNRIRNALGERDRLIFDWALYTGAREHEICNLLIDDIPPASSYKSRRVYAISILRKRHKMGELYAPTWLLDKTYQYITFFGRRAIDRSATKRGTVVPRNIFLGRWGTNLKPDSLYKTFKDALTEVGLSGTFHDLRHTYAICTLDQLMSVEAARTNGGHNALLELKHRMGHDSITTTEVYLRAREFYLTDIWSDLWENPDDN